MSLKPIHSVFLLLAVAPLVVPAALGAPPYGVSAPGQTNNGAIQIPARPTHRIPTPGQSSIMAPPSTSMPPGTPNPSVPVTPAPGFPGAPGASASPAAATAPYAGASTGTPATATGDESYTINAVMPLEQLLDDQIQGWSVLTGRTLLRSDATDKAITAMKATVSLRSNPKKPFTKAEFIGAIETVLGMNGITIVPIGDKFAKLVLEANVNQAGGSFSTSTNNVPDMGRYVTQIIQWKYASAEDIGKILELFSKNPKAITAIPSTQTLILRDYAENVKRMMEMVERIDVPSTFEMKPEIIAIKYALASDIQQVLSSLGGGGSGVSVGGRGTGASGSTGSRGSGYGSSRSSGMGGMGGMGGYQQGGMGGMGGSMGMGGMGSGTGGGGNRSNFQRNVEKLVSSAAASGDFQILGQSKIIADERTNSLLVFANGDDMKMIKLIIAKLDVVLAQVLIEAIIMEVSLNKNSDVGISYLQNQRNFGTPGYPIQGVGGLNNGNAGLINTLPAGSSATNSGLGNISSGFSYLTSFGGALGASDLDVVATAIAGDSRANVLSRPRIQTSHAVPCSLFIGQTVPVISGTYYGSGYAGGNSSQYSQQEVGIRLEVLPLINPEGLVVMDIHQEIDALGATVKIDGNDVPTTTRRDAEAKVAVRDRETIMLGGFISASQTKSHSGIPWLMDVPLLGALFRSNTENNDKVELIVLLRPTVLPTPQSAAIFAGEERNKMSGVKQAELGFREDERKNNEAIEKALKIEADRKAKKDKADAKKGKQPPVVVPHFEDTQAPVFNSPTNNMHIDE